MFKRNFSHLQRKRHNKARFFQFLLSVSKLLISLVKKNSWILLNYFETSPHTQYEHKWDYDLSYDCKMSNYKTYTSLNIQQHANFSSNGDHWRDMSFLSFSSTEQSFDYMFKDVNTNYIHVWIGLIKKKSIIDLFSITLRENFMTIQIFIQNNL